MGQGWYIKEMGVESGPLSSSTLKSQAQDGTIMPETLVRRGTDGEWVSAHRIHGLFDLPDELVRVAPNTHSNANTLTADVATVAAPSTIETVPNFPAIGVPSEPKPAPPAGSHPNLIPCRDCGEQISRRARSCPHCGCPWTQNDRPAESPERPKTEKRYKAIQVFAWFCRILALVIVGIGFSTALLSMLSGEFVSGAIAIAAAVISAIVCFFQGELLSAIIDIEQNTRRNSELIDVLIDAVWTR